MEVVGKKKILSTAEKKKLIALTTWHEQLFFLKEKNCSAASCGSGGQPAEERRANAVPVPVRSRSGPRCCPRGPCTEPGTPRSQLDALEDVFSQRFLRY